MTNQINTFVTIHFSKEMKHQTHLLRNILTNQSQNSALHISEPLPLKPLNEVREYSKYEIVELKPSPYLNVTPYGEVFTEETPEIIERYQEALIADLTKRKEALENDLKNEDPKSYRAITLHQGISSIESYSKHLIENNNLSISPALSALSFKIEGSLDEKNTALLKEGIEIFLGQFEDTNVIKIEYKTITEEEGVLEL